MVNACGKDISDFTLSFHDCAASAFCRLEPCNEALLVLQLYASATSRGYVDARSINDTNESGYKATGERRDCNCSLESFCGTAVVVSLPAEDD
jgi:hypothetical protein